MLGQLFKHSGEHNIAVDRESRRRSVDRPNDSLSSPHDLTHSSDSIHSSGFAAKIMEDCECKNSCTTPLICSALKAFTKLKGNSEKKMGSNFCSVGQSPRVGAFPK